MNLRSYFVSLYKTLSPSSLCPSHGMSPLISADWPHCINQNNVKMASPYHLPIELWQMIWKELADDNCKRKHLGRHPHVHYAAINRDWQNYFESLHFRQLILSTPECISALNQNVTLRRRRLVQRIWLRVHLFNPEQPMTFGLDLLGTRQPDMKTEVSTSPASLNLDMSLHCRPLTSLLLR